MTDAVVIPCCGNSYCDECKWYWCVCEFILSLLKAEVRDHKISYQFYLMLKYALHRRGLFPCKGENKGAGRFFSFLAYLVKSSSHTEGPVWGEQLIVPVITLFGTGWV